MNSFPWQLASWAERLGHRKPFYLAVIDGETRIGFVNSHFHLQFQQPGGPESALFRCLIDDRDLRRFDHAVTACLAEEKDIQLEARMRSGKEAWIRWELRFLEAMGEGPGRLFCLGYDLAVEEAAEAAADARDTGPESDPGELIRELQHQLIRQKELAQKKMREACVRAEHLERERIGQELHDNVCQILTSAQLYLSCLTPDNEDFETLKKKTAGILASAIEEVRALSHTIVPPALPEKGLVECVSDLVDDIRYTRHLSIDFSWSDQAVIETQDRELKQTVFRIIQEQMHNIGKYSRAANVRITLQGVNEQLRLQISDDGVGFDPKTVRQGLGLNGIIRRAKLFNGKAIFNSAPGKGCTLIVAIPLELKRIL
jgi:signal transduction histidine kinase